MREAAIAIGEVLGGLLLVTVIAIALLGGRSDGR